MCYFTTQHKKKKKKIPSDNTSCSSSVISPSSGPEDKSSELTSEYSTNGFPPPAMALSRECLDFLRADTVTTLLDFL